MAIQGVWHESDNPCGAVGKVGRRLAQNPRTSCRARREVCSLSRRRLFHLRAAACRVGLRYAGDREPEWLSVAGDCVHDRGPLHDVTPAVLRNGWNYCGARLFPEELRGPACQSSTVRWSPPHGGMLLACRTRAFPGSTPRPCESCFTTVSDALCLHSPRFGPPPQLQDYLF